MIVCLCEGVSDREVSTAIREGARTVESVGRKCGAGTSCGGCSHMIEKLLRHESTVTCQHAAPATAAPSSSRVSR